MKINSKKIIISCLSSCMFILPNAINTYAGTYTSSAHGNSSTGVSGRATDYETGNCAHCHDQHASRINSTHTPNNALRGLSEENLCLDCHDGSPATRNISTVLSSSTYTHNVSGYSGLHKVDEDSSEISANKHVECTDCHNPHKAGSTKHSKGVNTIASTSPLYGAQGAVVSSWNGNWSGANTWTQTEAGNEYEVCFKCHSSFNTNYASWGGSGAGAWSDVALEFNPNNKSYHPIVNTLSAGSSSSLSTTQLISPWSSISSTSRKMYCSDCHNTDTGVAQGPHGSDIKWMLTGTNTAWPYTNSSDNGTSSGTFFYLSGTTSNLFCMNCHPDPTSSGSNNVHQKGDHKSNSRGQCTFCHIRVPHGGKVSRLICADNSGSGLPQRYYPDGNGGGTRYLEQFKKATSKSSYDKSNCKTSCYSKHSSTVSSYESW